MRDVRNFRAVDLSSKSSVETILFKIIFKKKQHDRVHSIKITINLIVTRSLFRHRFDFLFDFSENIIQLPHCIKGIKIT